MKPQSNHIKRQQHWTRSRTDKAPNGAPGSKDPAGAARKGSRRKWILLALLMVLVFGGTWAFFERVVWARVPAELVGKWVVTEGPDEGGTVDFFRNGTMVAIVNNAGMEGRIEARVRVEGTKIHVTTTNQQTGEEGTRVQTIKTIDAGHLVLEDERGMSVKLERAK